MGQYIVEVSNEAREHLRRLDKKNRMCYTVSEDVVEVYVVSALGHYGEK